MAETTPPKPSRKREREVVVEPELSEYELHRNKRIKENQAFLESLGLGDNGQKLPKKPATKRKRKRKVEEHEKRKSVRLAGGPAPIERLADDPRSYAEERRKRAPRVEASPLTDEQRDRLGDFCMEEFYDWLGTTTPYHREISPDNRKTVIRQVTKLVTGVGVDYHRWPAGVVFRKGEPVTLQDDLAEIKEDAKDFEAQHGRDLGNGWLLNHPLQKMILFRDHLAATKLPGKARKKTKAVPRAPSSDDDDDDDDEAAAAPPPQAKPAKGALSPETVRAIREAKKCFDEGEIDEATFKETKAGLLMVGRQVRKRFPGSGWFDGVIESVEEDGRCEIAWSDGAVTSMKVGAVAKILKD